jgi:lysozyme family protein
MLDDIITDVMKAEGWDTFTNDPVDRGGPTKWGITQKAWADWRGHDVTAEDVEAITEPQARDFYEEGYIISPRFNLLGDQLIAMVVDCGVNHGVTRASKWVQKAVGATQDGVIGPKTIEAVQGENPIAVYLRVCASRTKFYGKIVSRDPTQAKFISGWNNRAAKWLERLADYVTGG